MPTIDFELPIETVSELNRRECWQRKAARAKKQRADAKSFCTLQQPRLKITPQDLPIDITFIRLGPRRLDTDNLAASLKAVRDGVCDWLGMKDGVNDKINFFYEQEIQKFYRSIKMKLKTATSSIEPKTPVSNA